jgi:hypothetical protein
MTDINWKKATAAFAVLAFSIGVAAWVFTASSPSPSVEQCAAAIGTNYSQPQLPQQCQGLTDAEQRAALQLAIDQHAQPAQKPTHPADSTPSAPTAPRGTTDQPLTIAGKFTITVATPTDTAGKWACNPIGADGHCQLHSELTVTITAIEPVALDKLYLEAVDDNHEKLWLGNLGPSLPLPAGKTHIQRDIHVDYSQDAKTRVLPLIWVHLWGDETHLAEWTYSLGGETYLTGWTYSR